MEELGNAMDANLQELTQKIDFLTNQVAYLTEQAQAAERARQEQAELLEIAVPIAKDAMRLASDELEEVQEYVRPEDLVRLLKKLVRHGPQFELLLDQVDAVTDLIEVIGPIPRQGLDKATELLAELERKGYFAFSRGGLRMLDNIVTSFSEEDVDRLGENIVLILNTVKDLTQPELMTFVRNTLAVAENEVAQPVNASLWAILGQMRDPAVRRGLALTLRVLKVVGQQAEKNA
jgi:uncharacterized protein YjgD (DUF1641 family)